MKIVNKTGYLKGAKTAKNPVNIIPSNLITTQGMAFPIKANGKTLYPNTGQYKFPTSPVVETPLKKKFQEGVEEVDNEEVKASKASQFTYRIKDKKRRDTQVRDMYNNTLDSFGGDTTNAKRLFKSFFKSYGSERFNDVKPLEGYYGFDMKDYNDKTLDSLGRDWHKKMKVSKKEDGSKNTKAKTNLGPTIENAKKLKSKGPQLFPTPTLNLNAPAKKFSNTSALNDFTNEALYGEQGRQMIENSPNVKALRQKEKIQNYLTNIKNLKPEQTKASGRVDMTVSPIDAAIVGIAGLPAATGRMLSTVVPKAVGAVNTALTTPLTTAVPGVTAGNILSSYAAADAITNRLPQIPGQIKRGEYGGAAENVLTGGLDLLGANMLNPNAVKVITDNPAIKVGRDLRKIKAQGLKEGLSDYEIAKRQLEQVGITSNQRKAYIPGVSDLLSEYVYPYSYGGMAEKNKFLQTLKKVIRNETNSSIATGKNTWFSAGIDPKRLDAWRMYLGKPQQNNTFRMAETAPVNHSSYTPEQLKDMDIMSVNYENTLIPSPSELEPLIDPITISRDNTIMGGYNRRLSSSGLEYNDIWDLEPKIHLTDFVPNKVLSKVEGNKFFDKLLYSKANKDVLTPRGIKLPVHKWGIGKPFMSHGNIPEYTWQKHKQNAISAVNKKITKELDLLNNFEENTPEFKKISDNLNQELIYRDALDGLPEIKKKGAKVLKYKNGSKSVSLAFSRGEKDPKGGLTQKGVDKYNRATGGNLKMAVTTPPSKLKPGSKAANRRKSFCARMSGVKGPMAKNGKPTRKALALRKWNC
jgi:hypothetical protein